MAFSMTIDAYYGIISLFTKGCELKLRKDVIDLTGQQFGDLKALQPDPIRRKNQRGVRWICECICGKTCSVSGGHLRMGTRHSCGCRSQRYIHRTGINRLMSRYKRQAKKRNKEFSLSWEQFAKLVTGNCNYCNICPSQKLKRLKNNQIQIEYNGIDCVNPKQGYTPENSVSCCYYCNHGKADLEVHEFIEHIKRIYKWHQIDS